ncbi:NAD(P)H-dependent oxidoreductase [Sphingomonas yantingensis]
MPTCRSTTRISIPLSRPEWTRLRKQIARMDSVILCAPEYNCGVSAAL